jgi:type IV pilus assembly protein PilP
VNRIAKNSFWLIVVLLIAPLFAQEKNAALIKPQKETARTSVAENVTAPITSKDSNGNPKTANPGAIEKVESRDGKALAPENPQPASVVGRRDPFRPITLNLRTNVRHRENLSPLERFELGQLKLVGIIWNIKNPTALVEDTSGLGYTVKAGTPIGSNDGKVKLIGPDALLIEEEYIDLYGTKKKREVSMRLAVERSE